MKQTIISTSSVLVLLFTAALVQAREVVFPPGLKVEHGFIDVKRDAGAKGDGITDDTKAFNDAMQTFPGNGFKVLYIPNGTYLISGTIFGKIKGDRWTSRIQFVGQNREKTIIRIKDNSPHFQTGNPMIITG